MIFEDLPTTTAGIENTTPFCLVSGISTASFVQKSESRKIFIFGLTTSISLLQTKFHNLSIEIGRWSYKWQ